LVEEFYIELLNSKSHPKVPPGVLGNYEVALLCLQKFGTSGLTELVCRELNPDAFGVWIQSAGWIDLTWDIPELVSRIPEKILGSLYLEGSQIQELPNLTEVEWSLFLSNSQIQALPKLERIGENLYLSYSQIEKLPNLVKIGMDLILSDSQIQELPKLVEVVGSLNLRDSQIQELPKLKRVKRYLILNNSQIQELPNLAEVGVIIAAEKQKSDYWIDYFSSTGRPHLAEKVKS